MSGVSDPGKRLGGAPARSSKATTTQPSADKFGVNRRLREEFSPSRSPSPASSTTSRRRGPSRSPSPFRKNAWLRDEGSVRGRGDARGAQASRDRPTPFSNRDDVRHGGIRYHDDRKYNNGKRQQFRSERNTDAFKDGASHYEGAHHSESKRRRTSSRSPQRQSDREGRLEPVDLESRSKKRDANSNVELSKRHKLSNERSVVAGGRPQSHHSADNGNEAEPENSKVANLQERRDTAPSTHHRYSPLPFSFKPATLIRSSKSNEKIGPDTSKSVSFQTARGIVKPEPAVEPDVPTAPVELSIEERRKRREAILAKHRKETTPLHVQAVEAAASSAASPASPQTPARTTGDTSDRSCESAACTYLNGADASNQVSPEVSTPATPSADSDAGFPEEMHITDDNQLAHSTKHDERPDDSDEEDVAAADYEASMDMRDDRRQAAATSVSAVDFDERKQEDRDIVEKADREQKPTTGGKPSAGALEEDDDDDDMFADIDPAKLAAMKPVAPAKKGQALDENLLDNWDDPEGYYRIIVGELLDGQYQIKETLGKGVFSNVVRAVDQRTDDLVAIKIVRANETMTKAGNKEIETLERLIEVDPTDKRNCIRLRRHFTHKGHLCLVFENLGLNLREIVKKFGRDVGINIKAVRNYAEQMFQGLSLLRKCNLLHADLKPDNILLSEDRKLLKVCDLGSAEDATNPPDISSYFVSRFYRAPEIILGMKPDYAIDMWSIGCTLFEMYTGKILFTGKTNNQMLKSMMDCRGKFSLKMLKKGEFSGNHFDDKTLEFRSVEDDKITNKQIVRMINVPIKPKRDLKTRVFAASSKALGEADTRELNLFVDLLDKCLALNPERRITPHDALKHPFILRAMPPVQKSAASVSKAPKFGFKIRA